MLDCLLSKKIRWELVVALIIYLILRCYNSNYFKL